ncbi:protease HtpX [Candidatus Methylopumilus universalis]|jgi:heat shock protein HtpX|uniref:protease HtpX n=1 Tax=Candidatus Methylopumilus universalis TaxID=2588536 RepID=UPI0011243CEB|nr:protease HtpX [Candidatus Methylopumilus universalis]QDC79506.1 protease HtpX [Candidatus Methylopumilus universalis]QDC80792.1 protease HtpX [Candidatus Methylopumilus universalis]QDC82101.1 protease HtpX [Candidatus Methylopumilus universalis]QDC88535.1 protease HtpX [Candidatus Methylopumilus universalis]
MKRIFYFLVTNLAIVLVLSITMRLLGVEPFLNANGLNLNSLLIFAAVMGFGGAFISLAISKWSAKQMSGAVTIENPKTPDEIWLMNIVKKQSQAVGIQMPEVAIFNSPVVNAFATGMSRNSSLVAVSSGLLEMMTKDEAEAVIGHEISHIANGDMVTLTLIQGVVNTFVLFFSRVIGYTVDKVVFKTRQGTGPAFFITMIISELLLGVLASIVVMWFSRQREYRADFGGGQLAGKQKMIAALQRLKTQYETSALPKSIAALGISGEQGIGLKELFSTHPSLDDRIARLQQSTN